MRAAQETCSRTGSMMDPDAIVHLGPANAATTVDVVRRWTCDHPSAAEKAGDMVRIEHQTPASRENIGMLRAQREKNPRMPSGEAQKLFIHPAEAPENNSIARVSIPKWALVVIVGRCSSLGDHGRRRMDVPGVPRFSRHAPFEDRFSGPSALR